MARSYDDFENQDCVTCFIQFRVPNGFTDRRRQDKQTFYCPNGHSMSYTESEADQLRRERDKLKQNQAWYEDQLRAARAATEQANAQARAFKGVATRTKNRVGAGVCPCCNRTLAQLQRHMSTKHKGWRAEEVAPGGAVIQ